MEALSNPQHPLPADVNNVLNQLVEAEQERLDDDDRLAVADWPDENERALLTTTRIDKARERGIDVERLATLDTVNDNSFARLSDAISDRIKPPRGLPGWLFEPPPPSPPDPSFWWATTYPYRSNDFRTGWRKDGLWFTGGANSTTQSLKSSRFGMTAYFELTPDRMPHSASGRFVSAPYVDLLGVFLAWTSEFQRGAGRLLGEMLAAPRPAAVQFGLGQEGPVPVVHAQNHERITLVDEANSGSSVRIRLPGRRDLQPLVVRDLKPGRQPVVPDRRALRHPDRGGRAPLDRRLRRNGEYPPLATHGALSHHHLADHRERRGASDRLLTRCNSFCITWR